MRNAFIAPLCPIIAAVACTSPVYAQFSWDGDCSPLWYECCNFGSEQNPLWANNWTIDPSPSSCPPTPGPNDSASISGVVDSQHFQIGLAGLFQSGTFLCRAQTLTINNGGNISVMSPLPPDPPSEFRLIDGSIINLMDGATIDVGRFSIFDFHAGQIRMFGEPAALMHIGGLGKLTKTAQPDAFTDVNVPIDNQGTITVETGTLRLSLGGTSDGLIAPMAGTTLRLEGTWTDIDGEVDGDGTIWFAGGTYTITGNYHPRNTHIIYGNGGATVYFNADNSIESLTLGNSGALGGSGDLTIDDFTWNEGSMLPGGTTIIDDSAVITSVCGCTKTLQRNMEIHGECVIEPNALVSMDEAELRIEKSGEIDLRGNSQILDGCCTLNSGVKNYGTIKKTGGNTSVITSLVSNLGTIDVQAGTLRLDAEMASTGSIIVNSGAEVVLGHGNGQYLFPQASVTGEGTLRFTGGVLDWIEGTVDVPTIIIDYGLIKFQSEISTGTLHMIEGNLAGAADFIVNQQLNWTGGTMTDDGVTRVLGELRMTSGQGFLQRKLVLDHAALPEGSCSLSPDVTGHMTILEEGKCFGNGMIDGNVNHNHGQISPGTEDFPIGHICIAGSLGQSWQAVTNIDLHGPTNYDSITVGGNANVGGALFINMSGAGAGQAFTIVSAGSVSGTFGPVFAPPGTEVEYTPTSVIIRAPFGPPQLVDFDVYPDGSPVQASDVFTDQWASVGVILSDGAQGGPGPSANSCSISPPNHAAAGGLIVATFVDPCTGAPSATDKVSLQQDWCWVNGEGLDVYAYDAKGAQIGHQFVQGGGAAASFEFNTQVIARLDIYHIGQGIDNLSFTLPASVPETCPADIAPPPNGNGIVNVQDLLAVISSWGACATFNCPADVAPAPCGNDVVNVQDLLAVISAWGPCP